MRSPIALGLLLSAFIATSLASPKSAPHPNAVISLTDETWRDVLTGEWIIQFHAPWCPACRAMAEGWAELGRSSHQLNMRVARADVTDSPALSGRFFITALPTILHVRDGQFQQYRGPRDVRTLKKMLSERNWAQMEPISGWKHPDSWQMTIVAYFFRLSFLLKETNMYLQDTYKLPIWLTYALFAVVTITLGALIGLVFVFIVDYVAPPRRKTFEELERDGVEHDYPADDLVGDDERVEDVEEEADTSDGEKYSDEDEEDEEASEEQRAEQLAKNRLEILEGDQAEVEGSKLPKLRRKEAEEAERAAERAAEERAAQRKSIEEDAAAKRQQKAGEAAEEEDEEEKEEVKPENGEVVVEEPAKGKAAANASTGPDLRKRKPVRKAD